MFLSPGECGRYLTLIKVLNQKKVDCTELYKIFWYENIKSAIYCTKLETFGGRPMIYLIICVLMDRLLVVFREISMADLINF